MIGEVSLFNILLPVLIVVAIVSRGFRVDDDYMATWANWFNLDLAGETRSAVRRYLQWSRRSRTAGGLVGFLAPTFYFEAVAAGRQPADIGGWAVTMMLVGYLLGALIAEVVLDPPRGRSQTTLGAPIRLADYLPNYAVVLQRGLAIASVLLVGLYALAVPGASISGLPNVTQVVILGAAAACLAGMVEAAQRRIVSRPRPVANWAGDDAMRASSLYVLAGGGIAVLANVAGPMLILSLVALAPAETGPPMWAALVALGFVFLSSIYFWLYFGKPGGFGWGTRQPRRPRRRQLIGNDHQR